MRTLIRCFFAPIARWLGFVPPEEHVARVSESYRAGREDRGPLLAQVADALQTPTRWQISEPLTEREGQEWKRVLASPVGRKVDLLMWQFAQGQAQAALIAPDLKRAAGTAHGVRVGWEVAKSLSAMVAAQDDQPDTGEPDPDVVA